MDVLQIKRLWEEYIDHIKEKYPPEEGKPFVLQCPYLQALDAAITATEQAPVQVTEQVNGEAVQAIIDAIGKPEEQEPREIARESLKLPERVYLTDYGRTVLTWQYVKAKTGDLREFGYVTLKESTVREQLNKVLYGGELDVIGHFMKGEVELVS